MQPRHLNLRGKPASKPLIFYDSWLLAAVASLLIIGLMMVGSSSIMISTKHYHFPFYFLVKQSIYCVIGLIVAAIVLRVPSFVWEKLGTPLLFLSIFLLFIVLFPGIGRVVNGSRRWLVFGPIGIQVSEIVKITIVFYMAGYFVRQQQALARKLLGFLKPLMILVVIAALLLAEPDFGATVVIVSTVLAMLFLAGVRLRYYLGLAIVIAICLLIIAISSPYRLTRMTTFLDPWADQFNSGYQLTQALIAFGRGGWYGLGLGDGVQKLLYLPEAHTDFLFAVLAEEFGLCGVIIIFILYGIIITRGLLIGFIAYKQNRLFAAFTAYGLIMALALQALINIGVNIGLLPTKGLTLPFLSYGGASLVMNLVLIAILLRIDYENRWRILGL